MVWINTFVCISAVRLQVLGIVGRLLVERRAEMPVQRSLSRVKPGRGAFGQTFLSRGSLWLS